MRRGVSNPKKSQPSNLLENEAKKMEDKLLSLKQAMTKEKTVREDKQTFEKEIQLGFIVKVMRTSGSRWKTATVEQPIKNYANKILEKKAPTLTQQSSNTSSKTIKSTDKPPALKIGNLTTNPEIQKPIINKIPKRPSNITSRPSSNQSSRSALNKSLTGKENENNLNSSFRRTLNTSFETPVQHQASTSMTQFTQQTDDKDQYQDNKSSSSLKNSGIDFSVQMQERKPQKMIQTKLNELSQNNTQVIAQKKSLAESNLLKHLNQQKELQKEVHQFLSSVNLLQYQQVFEDNGFDDLETILEINTEIMNSMKIPAGHQIKISKRIETLKIEEQQVEELHREKEMKDQQSESSKVKNLILYPSEKRTDLEELEPPSEEQDQYDSNYRISSSTSTNKKTQEIGGELLNGVFNEEESHKSFLQALMEFRNQGKKKDVNENTTNDDENGRANLSTADQRKKSVRFADGVLDNEREHTLRLAKKSNNQESEDGTIRGFGKNQFSPQVELNGKEETKAETSAAKSPFFYSSGGDSWSNDNFPYQVDAQMETDPKSDPNYGRKPRRDIDKISCYNCYKLVPLGEEKTFNIKNFCSNQCLQVYKGSSYITCQCGQKELKDEATFVKATWFCSEVCALELKDKPNNKYLNLEGDIEIDSNNNINYEQDGEIEIDLDFGDKNPINSSKVLTLEQLEKKYKNAREPSSSPKKKTQKK